MSYLKIQNDYLRLEVSGLGAELQSIIDQRTGKQYLWQADPAYWGRKSPLLFPIIGSLKDNEYLHQEKTYGMNKHGIVRDAAFELVSHESDCIVYQWHNNSDNYPFTCSVYVTYQLDNNSIIVSYRVVNEGSDDRKGHFRTTSQKDTIKVFTLFLRDNVAALKRFFRSTC